VLPAALAQVHPRFRTPASALLATTIPLILIGGGLELRGLTVSPLFDQLGGFAVLAFLLVYGMVAVSALSVAVPGIPRLRRWLVAGSSLAAVVAVALGYLWSVLGQQTPMLISFAGLMLIGMALVFRRSRLTPADP
jgi:amino acid transporter